MTDNELTKIVIRAETLKAVSWDFGESNKIRISFEADYDHLMECFGVKAVSITLNSELAVVFRSDVNALIIENRTLKGENSQMRANLDEWAPFIAAHGLTRP